MENEIRKLLKDFNLNFDNETINKVVTLLLTDIGLISDIKLQLQVYSGAAIISQISTLPTIGKKGLSKNGIKIENVMSHLGDLSKERYLDTLNKQLEKLKDPPQIMKKRIEDIRFSYRFYKKYQNTFQIIYSTFMQNKSIKQNLSALFWIIYLYIKNTFIETQNIGQAKILLILLFRNIFQNFITKISFEKMFLMMQNNIGKIPEISKQNKIEQKINFFYSQRFFEQTTNFQKLINNYTYIQRLVDDMSNAYAKDQRSLAYFNQIDELSYLQLKKNLTPQVFRKIQPIQNIQPICKSLSFEDDSDDENAPPEYQNTPVKPSNIANSQDLVHTPCYNKSSASLDSTPEWSKPTQSKLFSNYSLQLQNSYDATPIHKKQKNEHWISYRQKKITSAKIQQFKKRFETVFKKSYSQFQMELKQKNFQITKTFLTKNKNYEQIHQQMLSFFIGNCLQIQQESSCLFLQKNFDLLKGIACLSSELFNYIKTAVNSQFKHHCQLYGIQISVIVKSIKFFQLHIAKSMNPDLKNYIQKMKKLFFVSEIWQKQVGYKNLCQSQNPKNPKYNQICQIYKIILTQSEKRVKQISKQAKIESKIIHKTINMMEYILQKKPYLLKQNNLDQIILCCLMSCLSINQKEQNNTLSNLFCEYNSNIQFSYNSNQAGLKDSFGNQMKIVEYYNDVFLNEIQDIITNSLDNIEDFLLTPVKINMKSSFLDSQKSSNFSVLSMRQKNEGLGTFSFNPEKTIKQRKQSYFQSLIKNSQMKQQQQQDEQDIPSPNFGLERRVTFGRSTSKKEI